MEDIPHVAALLGIDPVREPQFLWIAELALSSNIDSEEWDEFTNSNGQVMYYNKKVKVQAVHPTIATFGKIYHRQKGYWGMIEQPGDTTISEERQRMLDVLRAMNNCIDKQEPVSSPEILLDLCALAGVDPKTEFVLARCIKASVETYANKQYDLSLLIEDLREPVNILRDVEKKKITVDVFGIPSNIIMCDECEKRSSVVKCEQCQDTFCQECFDELHATGNRRAHLTQELEQLVCVACDCSVAACQCIQCGSFFCSPCFASIHGSRSDLNKHRRRNISGLVCLECEHAHATVICEDCVDLFCSPCFLKVHKKGQRKKHAHLTMDVNGQAYRGGLVIPPPEAAKAIESARSRSAYSPWVAFKTRNPDSCSWYNLSTGDRSTEPPSS